MKDIKKDPFEEYIKNLPPTRRELAQAWSTAIGLQDVDGLKPSEYLYTVAKRNIDGEISIDEEGRLISKHGQVEYLTTIKYINECLAGIPEPVILCRRSCAQLVSPPHKW